MPIVMAIRKSIGREQNSYQIPCVINWDDS